MEQDTSRIASTSYPPPDPPPPAPPSRRVRRRRSLEEGDSTRGRASSPTSLNTPPQNSVPCQVESNMPRGHPYPQPQPSTTRNGPSLLSVPLRAASMAVFLSLLPTPTAAFPFANPFQQRQPPSEPHPPAPAPTQPPLPSFPSRKGKEREVFVDAQGGPGPVHLRRAVVAASSKKYIDRYTPAADGSGTWEKDESWELFGVRPTVNDLAEQQSTPSSTASASSSTPTSSASVTTTSTSATSTISAWPRDWKESTKTTRDAFELPLIIACTVSLAVLVVLTIATFISRRNKRSRRARREKRRATAASRDSTVSVDIAGLKEKAAAAEEGQLRGGKWKGGVVGVLRNAGKGRGFLRRRKGKKGKGKDVSTRSSLDEDGRRSADLDAGRGSGEGRGGLVVEGETPAKMEGATSANDAAPRPSVGRARSPPPPSTSPSNPTILGSAIHQADPSSPTISPNLNASPSSTHSELSTSAPAPSSPPPPHPHYNPVPPTYRASTMISGSSSPSSSSQPQLQTRLTTPPPSISVLTFPPAPPTTPHGFPVDDKSPFPASSSSNHHQNFPSLDEPELEPTSTEPSSPSHHHHLATDDKSALARLASQASAPDSEHAQLHEQESSAPAWDDEQLPESVIRESHASSSPALPAPPRARGGKTMEDPYLPPLELENDEEKEVAPSAPMMHEDAGEEVSATPLELEHEPSAPPLEDDEAPSAPSAPPEEDNTPYP